MSYRPALAKQLEAIRIPADRLNEAIEIKKQNTRLISTAVGFGAGTFIATQLVLRYRFGNI